MKIVGSIIGVGQMAGDSPFSKRLKEARQRAGLTQEQLGLLAGISESNASAKMNQYEQGTHTPKFPRVKELAAALKVPTAYFFAETGDLAELLYGYETLSASEKRALLKQVQR